MSYFTFNIFLISVALYVNIFFVQGQLFLDNSFGGDEESAESINSIQVVRPLTFGAAVQAEIERLESLKSVFPPKKLSYFIPYGDRTTLSFQFPKFTTEDLAEAKRSGYGYGPHKQQQQQAYGPPKDAYGPPKDTYGPPKQKTRGKAPEADLGIIIAQNYIYRENIRDFENFSKLEDSLPSNELIIQLAKEFSEKNAKTSRNPINPYSQNSYGPSKSAEKSSPSFVIVAIESRIKVSPDPKRFGFQAGNSLSNGTIIFPSAGNPSVLTNIPFVLRHSGDIEHVFDGYQEDSQFLLPKDKTQIMTFLGLLNDVHEDVHQEGRAQIQRLQELSETLERPRLPNTTELEADNLANDEKRARLTHWLYSSTVGLRTLSPAVEEPYEPPQHNPNDSYQAPHHAQNSPQNSYQDPQQQAQNSYQYPQQQAQNSYQGPQAPHSQSNSYLPAVPPPQVVSGQNTYQVPQVNAKPPVRNAYTILPSNNNQART